MSIIKRLPLIATVFTLGVTGAVVASIGRAPVTDLEYVTAADGDTYDTLAASMSCDGDALGAANARAVLEPGVIVLVPPSCQDVAPPETTLPPETTTPPETTVPPTTQPPSGDPLAVTFNAVRYTTPEKRATTTRGQIGFSVLCPYSHSNSDDPIVYPGQPGRAHLHDFFGARTVDAHTTVADLQHMPNLCGTSNDRSAYWAPAVYMNGQKVRPGNTTFYYKPGVDPRTSVQPIPFGMQMIAGDAMATTMQNPLHLWFQQGNTPSINTSSGVMPSNPQLRITFPDCWDGRRLTSPDQSHLVHNRGRSCPSSHPVAILQLTMFVQYPNGTNVSLSSGHWRTMHADFINVWHPDTMRQLIAECVVPSVRCGKIRDA